MIDATCHTNIDEAKSEKWPTKFVALPREGDWVESANGKVLRVCKVTHAMTKGSFNSSQKPIIRVELHRCA